jgi:hypothetical protein
MSSTTSAAASGVRPYLASVSALSAARESSTDSSTGSASRVCVSGSSSCPAAEEACPALASWLMTLVSVISDGSRIRPPRPTSTHKPYRSSCAFLAAATVALISTGVGGLDGAKIHTSSLTSRPSGDHLAGAAATWHSPHLLHAVAVDIEHDLPAGVPAFDNSVGFGGRCQREQMAHHWMEDALIKESR